MKRILTIGAVLGLLVAIWQFVYGFLGLYKSPGTAWTFTVVAVVIQVGVLVWGLRQTAQDGRRYWGQVGAAMLICLVASVIIVVSAFIFTGVAFPDYFDEVAAMQATAWANAGVSDAEIDALLERSAFMRTPVVGAASGAIGTLVTGFVIALITAAFVRAKD